MYEAIKEWAPASESRYYCALNQLKLIHQKGIEKSMSFSMCKFAESKTRYLIVNGFVSQLILYVTVRVIIWISLAPSIEHDLFSVKLQRV